MQNDLPKQDFPELTEREQEILRLIATGNSNKEIARQLFISSNTVKVHLRNIFAKIGVTSRTEAAVYAIHTGFKEAADLAALEPVNQELATSSYRNLDQRQKSLILWISIFVIVLVGVTTSILMQRTRKFAGPITVPVPPQRWHELAALPTARSGLGVAVYENQIYTIGGETEQGITGILERYNLETDKWTVLPNKPTPVTDITAVVIGGQLYLPGGRLATGGVTDILEAYDPS